MKRWAAFVLLLLMFSGACGLPIPTGTTAVHKVSGPQTADEGDPVKRIPPAPVDGESPGGIVQGFLAAGNELDIARLYLTAGNPWDPETTTVFTGDPVIKTTAAANGSMTAMATIAPILLINPDGSTQVPSTGALPFALKRQNGQWRIVTLPPGIELQQSDLSSSFGRGLLGWLAPDGTSLVRESVLLPDPESLIPNLVTTLIAGPTVSLTAAGVTSAVPSRWSADPPNLIGSQLSVGIHTNGADLVAANLAEIRAQFAATLLSTEVFSIQVTLNGQPLPAGTAAASPITAADETSFDRDLTGFAATGYVATAGGIAPLVLPASFGTSTPPAASSGPANSPTASRRSTPSATIASNSLTPHVAQTSRALQSPHTAIGASSQPTPSTPVTTPPLSVFNPGVPVTAFAVSLDGQRFAELREVGGPREQPVQINLGSSAVVPLGPARDYESVAWGTAGTLWLTTHSGAVYMALHDHVPQQVTTQPATPLKDLIIAPDGVHMLGISTAGALFSGLASAGAGGSGVSSLSQVAPSLKNVTAVAVTGSGIDGLRLLVAATQSVNPFVPGSAGAPVVGLWKVSTGAPDPTDGATEMLSESVAPVTATPCAGQSIVGLVARPTSVVLAECLDRSLEAFDQRPGPLSGQWVPVTQGLAGYPLG